MESGFPQRQIMAFKQESPGGTIYLLTKINAKVCKKLRFVGGFLMP
jgi:hypothetical protein